MQWVEVSLLELIVLENPKFYPLILDLRNFGPVLLALVPVSWFFGTSQN
jgi:hypothetical protein